MNSIKVYRVETYKRQYTNDYSDSPAPIYRKALQ